MKKAISILLSAVFIITLISSTPVSSLRISGLANQSDQGFIYLVKVNPSFVRVNQGEFGSYTVQVLRGSDAGQFVVDLSLVSDSSLLKSGATFNPPTLNFEQGQTAKNSTLSINSYGLDPGTLTFRVSAATQGPVAPDQASSNPVALIVKTGQTRESLNPAPSTESASQPSSTAPSQSEGAQKTAPTSESVLPKPNNPPVAKAGPDQIVKEGDKVTLDGSASTDPDKDALSFSWQQINPSRPSIKLDTSDTPNKVSFASPNVDRDTVLRFKLLVKDSNGGQAVDFINVLVKNVALAESPPTGAPQTPPEEQQGGQQNEEPASQVIAPKSDSSSNPTSTEGAAGTENHSPTAETVQIVSVEQDKPLSISLKGNDPDKDDTISYIILTNPSRGTIAGFDKASGLFTYMPSSNFKGQDRLSFKVVDNHGAESNDGLIVLRASPVGSQSTTSPSSSPTAPSSESESSSSTANGNATGNTTPVADVNVNGNATDAGSNANKNNNATDNTNSASSNANKNNTAAAVLTSPQGTNASALAKGGNQTAAAQNKTISSFAASASAVGEQYYFHLKWGGPGTLNGNFSNPHDIAIDSQGNVFVLDSGNNRVQKFDKTGHFISTSFPTTFSNPQGIAVDKATNEVYVVDTGNNLVKRFTNAGVLVKSWGGPSGSGPFNTPVDAAIDSAHNVYVSDANNHRIVKTDNNGNFLAKFGTSGNQLGQIKGPHAIAIGKEGANEFVWVVDADATSKKVVKYTTAGAWTGITITQPGFSSPHGIAIDSADNLFVTDRAANKVLKFNDQGGFLTSFGNPLPDPTTNFNAPDGIATSSDSILQIYVVDTGNNRVEVFSLVPPPSITITLDPTSPKWGHVVTASGTITSALADDKISITWGDLTPVTIINPAPASGQFTATHVYDASAISKNPNKVIGRLLTSQGAERARTPVDAPGLSVTVQKHVTQLTVALSHDSPVCASCALTLSGNLTDTDSTPVNAGVSGKTIAFSGSGVPPPVSSVQTEGVTFSGDSNNNVTLNSGFLRVHVGSHISLPATSYGVVYKFKAASSGSSVGVTVTKSDNTVKTLSASVGSVQQLEYSPNSVKDIAITSVGGSSSSSQYADLESIMTRNIAAGQSGGNAEQYQIDFGEDVGVPTGSYSTLVIDPGSYFTSGLTQGDANGLKITAAFAEDPAYLGATTSELSYDIDSSQAGVGEGSYTGNTAADLVWTILSVGKGGSGDVCTQNGVNDVDADGDGICDKWESATGGNGNTDVSPAHRYIVCPTITGFVAIDPDCANTAGSAPTIKYDLCFVDKYSDVWGGSANQRICPTVGHKDLYVEIDSMSNHVASDTAIRNVIKAFGNAPFTGTNDAFSRSGGITLHVVKDETNLVEKAPFFVWRDPSGVPVDTDDSFLEVKNKDFGTVAERCTLPTIATCTPIMPGMNNAGWISTGKVLKHYGYHYGLWINYYGPASQTTCPSAGLSSGLAETLGNDFVVSLGCGFKPWGTVENDEQQAGTFMHELGHNLNLAHGGPNSIISGVRTATDYNMNCKPDYYSVMNYARQIPNSVLTTGASGLWESGFNYGATGVQTALDYSRTTAPASGLTPGSITESAIDEAAGTAAANGRTYKVIYSRINDGAVTVGDSKANFDFSGDAVATSSNIGAGDINNLAPTVLGCGASAGQTLKSYNDWNDVKLVFLDATSGTSQDGITGAPPSTTSNTRELTPTFLNEVKDKAADSIEFIPPPNTDGSSVSNAGSSVPMKFRLRDADGNFVRDAVVTLVAKKATAPFTQFVGPIPSFVYNIPTEKYQYTWPSPSGGTAKGVWQIFYIQNYGTTHQILLQGPEAKAAGAPYTYTLTLK